MINAANHPNSLVALPALRALETIEEHPESYIQGLLNASKNSNEEVKSLALKTLDNITCGEKEEVINFINLLIEYTSKWTPQNEHLCNLNILKSAKKKYGKKF